MHFMDGYPTATDYGNGAVLVLWIWRHPQRYIRAGRSNAWKYFVDRERPTINRRGARRRDCLRCNQPPRDEIQAERATQGRYVAETPIRISGVSKLFRGSVKSYNSGVLS